MTKSKNKKYKDVRYNYSTEAYEYLPEGDYTHHSRRRKRGNQSRRSIRKEYLKAKKQSKYKLAEYENPGHSFKVYFTIVSVFLFSMAILSIYAYNTELKININQLTSELKEVQENNNYLQAELSKNIDLDKVQKIATTKLGMQKPGTHQIIYINVPKQSYTVQYDIAEPSVKTNKLDILKFFENLFNKE